MGKPAFTDSMNWRDEQAYEKDEKEIPVVMRLGETPVPIPNTKVKT